MDTTLQCETRSERGKNLARRLRRDGRLPGVVYGDSGGQSAGDVVAVSVDPGALSRILHSDAGVNTLIGLAIDADQGLTATPDYPQAVARGLLPVGDEQGHHGQRAGRAQG